MTSPTDPLSRLVVDEAAVNRELLATVLEHRIRLDLRQGTFTFLHGVRDNIGGRGLVVTALLARQALHLLDERHTAGLAPREIEDCTGLSGGTLRPILKRLADRGHVRRDDETGAYTIPGYSLEAVARELNAENNG